MDVLLLLIRLFLAGIFGVAGIAKLMDQPGAEKAVTDFGVPAEFAKPAAYLLSTAEILLALLLLFTTTSWLGALGALLLLLIFIAGMIYQLASGKEADCHCFGQLHSERVSPKSLVRNVLFSALALFLVGQGSDHQGLSLTDDRMNLMQFAFALIISGLLAAAIFYLKQIFAQQTQILRRIEILDVISREGGAVERQEAGDPNEGLPIGSPFPDFALPDLSGRVVSFEHLLAERKPTLFFFVAPTCTPCKALVPEIAEWESTLTDRVNFVLISRGKVDENREKFTVTENTRVLLQKDREVANLVNAKWTPTALFVDAAGNIASHIAAGDSAIRELVEKVSNTDVSDEFIYFTNSNGNGRKPLIGESVPEFTLDDREGQKVASSDLKGSPTLAAFWSTTCPHCINMMEDIREWEQNRSAADPKLIVFSDGDVEELKKIELTSPIVIDKEYKTAAKLGMLGTPSAVLIDENGRIISETAIGAQNIWALIGRRMN
ncbi:MAG TPA: TlpA disulfide reductase family protein [Pyrinomonadaceae bacterium]|nr:TlpA disulfide reductase family protein [Pyrinomonadaceae bacterium]